MERVLKREVLATLLKAGRRDLAFVFAAKAVSVSNHFEKMLTKMMKLDLRLSRNEMKRGGMPNPYRRGNWEDALERAKQRVKQHLDSMTPEGLEALKLALQHEFEPDFPPLKSTVKAIDKQLGAQN
jgi:hypothetical protein